MFLGTGSKYIWIKSDALRVWWSGSGAFRCMLTMPRGKVIRNVKKQQMLPEYCETWHARGQQSHSSGVFQICAFPAYSSIPSRSRQDHHLCSQSFITIFLSLEWWEHSLHSFFPVFFPFSSHQISSFCLLCTERPFCHFIHLLSCQPWRDDVKLLCSWAMWFTHQSIAVVMYTESDIKSVIFYYLFWLFAFFAGSYLDRRKPPNAMHYCYIVTVLR